MNSDQQCAKVLFGNRNLKIMIDVFSLSSATNNILMTVELCLFCFILKDLDIKIFLLGSAVGLLFSLSAV